MPHARGGGSGDAKPGTVLGLEAELLELAVLEQEPGAGSVQRCANPPAAAWQLGQGSAGASAPSGEAKRKFLPCSSILLKLPVLEVTANGFSQPLCLESKSF